MYTIILILIFVQGITGLSIPTGTMAQWTDNLDNHLAGNNSIPTGTKPYTHWNQDILLGPHCQAP